jgi:hypothetical protein
MNTYLPAGNERRRAQMVHRTQVMRFALELVDGAESFSAHWIDDADGVTHRCYFGHVSRFKAWLLHDQRYAEQEADSLIERLRAQTPPDDR